MLLCFAGWARAEGNFVTVQAQTVTNRFVAYAQVEPIAVLPVRAAQAGTVVGLDVLPGTSVRAGQKLAELGGPEVTALLAQEEASANGAQTNLLAARKSLAIEQRQLASHLVTHRTVLQAEGAVAQSQAALASAQAQLRALHQTISITAPTAGTVLAVEVANGERVAIGQTLLNLQPAGRLWLKAVYYGADAAAVHVGMTGPFVPSGSGKALPVKVDTVFAALAPDGGESVGLVATTSAPGWRNGEFGTLTLNGPTRSLVAVPTRALILDQGHWWVLVHTSTGDRRQRVVPGPTRGWQTFLESGLDPGTDIVVENAYLEFHRRIAQHYEPPD